MNNGLNSKMRYPFLLATSTFMIVVVMTFFIITQGDEELNQTSEAHIELEHLSSVLAEQQFLILRYLRSGPGQDNFGAESFISEFSEKTEELIGVQNKIKKNTSSGWLGSKPTRKIFFDNKWRLDENINHLILLAQKIMVEISAGDQDSVNYYIDEYESHAYRTQKKLTPINKTFEEKKKYINFAKTFIIYGVNIIFFLLLGIIYSYIYLPWRRDYENLESDKGKLQEVLRESEIRGNTFFWELNYDTKETKRSNQLSGIFEFDQEADTYYLYDEVALFSKESQEKFMKAIESCATKGEVFDIQVNLQTKNKKKHWLRYYAKRKEEGKDIIISGTVRDITNQRLAEARFEILFDSMSSPALIFGEGQIRKLNSAALKFFGVDDKSRFDKLHPAILFPLYQLDGRSSLEKLKTSLDLLKEGKVFQEDWSFQTSEDSDVVANVTLFNVPYPEIDLHLMVITDDSQRYEFERRLVDANRRALHSRRLKLEYMTHAGVLMQQLSELVKEEISSLQVVDKGHMEKLQNIQDQLGQLWEENLYQSMEEGSSIVLTDLVMLLESLESRWLALAREKEHELIIHQDNITDQYIWVDSSKLKLALMTMVEGAIEHGQGERIQLRLNFQYSNNRQTQMSLSVTHSDPSWPGQDWKKLMVSQGNLKTGKGEKKILNLKNFFNVVEILQGEIFFDNDDQGSTIGFNCFVEKAIGVSKGDMVAATQNALEGGVRTLSSADIWSHFGGEWDVIESTIKDFIDYYPTALADLFYYLKEKNSDGLQSTAADLYGVMAHFPFFPAIERVIMIQKLAKYLKFEKIESELEALSYDFSEFSRILNDFLPEESSSAA